MFGRNKSTVPQQKSKSKPKSAANASGAARPKLSLLSLESRLMFDAAAAATAAEVNQEQVAQEQAESAVSAEGGGSEPTAAEMESQDLLQAIASYNPGETPTEIAFIDPTVPDYQSLIAGMGPNIQIVMLDGGQDGMEQIATALSGRTGIDAIHLISHGAEGQLSLGTGTLTQASMTGQYADELATIKQALSEQADILVYGCDFAEGQAGQDAVTLLSQMTGADVAASTDATGYTEFGGDWVLEAQIGRIESTIVVTDEVQANWKGLLAETWMDAATGSVIGGPVGNDWYVGDEANNAPVSSAGGADIMYGAGGDDTLTSGSGNDILVGGTGNDTLSGGSDDDVLLGGTGNDYLDGGSAVGKNTIIGGGGNDQMVGGSGVDVFRFTGAQSGDVYTVNGGGGTDIIDLSEFSTATITNSGGVITVDRGGGNVFTINHSNVETIITAATIGNHGPLADAGVDQTVGTSSTVTLTAAGSSDRDGNTLTYQWTQIEGPKVTLSSSTAASPTFTAPSSATTLQFVVVVTDGTTSHADTVTITVNPPGAADDSVTTNEDTPVVISPLANDTGTATIIEVTQPTNGTVVNNGNGTVTYTPTANYAGSDSFTYATADSSAGLSHYWNLNGTATDSVGTANGTLNGTTTVAGSVGNGLSFNESSDYALIPDVAYASSFTLSFDFKLDDNSGSLFQYLYSHGSASATNSVNVFINEASHGTDPNVLRTVIRDGNDTLDNFALQFNIASIVGDGQWHTYTATVGPSGIQVYLDGVLKMTDATRGTDGVNPTGSVYLGARQDLAADRYFGGSLDSVRIYSSELTNTQVAALGDASVGTVSVTVNAVNDAPAFTIGDSIVTTAVGTGNDYGRSTTVQADGKILVTGYSSNGSNDDIVLIRYNADGTLDTSFGGGDGIATTAVGGGNEAGYCVAVQADGKILVGGTSWNGSNYDIVVVRYNTNGTLDTSFGGGDGIVTTAVGSGNDTGYGIVVQADGKFLITGFDFNGANDDVALIRYNANGTLDTSFGGGDGIVTTDVGGGSEVSYNVAVRADGKILVAGYRTAGSNLDFLVMQYNVDGTLDTSFGGGDGIVTTAVGSGNDTGRSMTVQADGKILVTGYSSNGSNDDIALIRYNADGTLDTSFGGGDGIVTTTVGSGNEAGYSVAVQADGKILVGGTSWNGSNYDIVVVRYNTNGTLDTSFGGGDGIVTTAVGSGTDTGYGIVVQADGRILVTGYSLNGSTNDVVLIRYNTDGTLDARFDLANTLDGTPTYIENGTAVVLDSNVQIFDQELSTVGTFAGATLTLARNGGADSQDVFSSTGTLSALTQGGNLVVGGVTIGTVTTNSGGTLLLTFNNNATNARVNAVMQQITYANNSDAPPASAQINWTFSDGNSGSQGTGGALTATGSTTVTITAVNDAPVLADTALSMTVAEDAGAPSGAVGSTISAFTGGITDVDSGASKGIAITGSNETNGTWYYTTNGGTTWTAVGSVSSASSLLLADNGSTRLYFAPSANYNGTSTAALTVRAWDQTSGTAGTKVTTASNGGTTAFSSATDTIDVSVTAVNDAPVFTSLNGTPTYTENGSPVVLDSNVTITDAELTAANNFNGATLTLTRNGGANSQDVFSGSGTLSLSGGNVVVSGTTIGTYTNSGGTLVFTFNSNATNTLVNSAMQQIAYSNSSDAPPSSVQINWAFSDGNSGGQGTGGALTATGSVTVSITAINDAPTITSNGGGATASLGVAEGLTAVTTVTATDVDAGQTLTFSIVGGADAAKFTINSSTGALSFVTAPNYEAPTDSGGNNIYDVTVQVSDGNGGTDTQALSVTVTHAGAGVTISSLEPTPLGNEYRVNTTTAGDQWAYYWSVRTVALAQDGSYVQVWIDTGGADGSQYGIYGQRYDSNGTAVGGQFLVNTTTTLKQDDASVAMAPDGSFVVLWDGPGDGNGTGVFGQRFAADGSRIGGEFQVNTSTASNQQYPELDFAADGSFVTTWVTQSGGPARTYFQRFDASGNKVGGEVVLNTGSSSDQILDSLHVKADGSFIVTWTEGTGVAAEVYGQLYDANTNPVSSAFQINQYTTGVQQYSIVRADANGNFVVVWESQGQDGSGNGVYMRRFAADGTALGNEVAVTTQTAGDQYGPVLAMDRYGNFVVAWGDSNAADGSGDSIWMQRFDASGNKVGVSMQVNQSTAGYQGWPVIDMNDDGRLVVAWEGSGSGDDYGVYARRYDLNPNVTEGSTSQFQVVLNTAPTSAVTLTLSVSDGTEASLSTTTLVFDSTNWNIPQTVTISGLQDLIADGDQSIRIITSALSSSDSSYNGLNPDNLVVLVQDSGVGNTAPVISSNGGGATASISVAENTTAVTTVAATDANTGQTLTYSIVGGADAAKFTINSVTGILSFITAPNYESPTDSGGNNIYDVTVQVSDSLGATDTQAIAVTVTNANETPTDLTLSANTVAENAANGTTIGTVSGTDPDSGDTKTYSFTDSAGGRFAINSSTGVITVANSSLLNYESATSHSVTVRVTDSGGLTYDETFTINLTNVNETPTDLTLSANTVAENAANGTIIGTVSGTDPDSGDTKSYSFTDSAGGRFAVNSSTGVITVANSSLLNYEAATSHSVTVRVTDSGGLTYDETFTINVTNVNEAPTGADATVTINEDTSHTLTTANFGFSDADTGDSLSAVRVDTLPGAGSLTLSGVAVTAGQIITAADITAGNLVFTPAANANGTGYASFTFSVRDSNSTYDTAPNTLTVNVTPVNDAPINTVPGAQTVAVDTPLVLSGLSVNDVDGNLSTVQLSVTNGTVAVTLSGGATISSGASGTSTLTLTGTQADINATLTSLTYQGNSLFTGTDTLTVVSTDSNSVSDTDTVMITVSNNAPTNVLPASQTVAEDTPLAISGLSVTDTDGNLATVQLSVTNGTLNLTLSGATTVSGGFNGSSTVTLSGTQADLNATLASLIYQGHLNFAGSDTLTITSTDSTGTADTDNLSITVTAVNDTPTDLSLSANQVAENAANGTTVGTVSGTDPDAGDTKTYSFTDSAGGRFAINSSTGEITVADGSLLDYEAATSHSVTVRVTDSGGLTYDETFTINLTNVNETPTDLSLSSNTVAENAANGTVIGTVSGTDPDSGDTKTYSFTNSAGGRFAINSSTGEITVADGSLLNYEAATSHNVTVRVTDVGGLTYDEMFTINVTDVNETPTDLSLSANTITENAATGTIIGTVTGTDPDIGDTKTYSLTDSAGGRFSIHSATGQISVANSSLLDYEAATSHTVTVRVMDGGGLTYDEMFTINLINVNETPTDLALSSNTVAEMAANGTVVGTASTTDPDAGDTQTYQLTDDAGGRFAIDSATGEITVMDGSLLCYEDAPSHTVTVRVTDAGGLTYDETFTINLTDVNEAPTGSDATITINEDTSHALTVADFGFSDMDAGDSLSAVRIDTLPTAGTLALSGVAVTAGQVITVADITAGNLVFTPAAEASGIGYATFTFSVRDSGNLYDSGPNTLTSDVTAVNDAPVNTVPGAQTVAEDTPITITGLSVNDVDGNLSTVQLDVSNGTLWVSLAGGATISAGANDSGTLTLSGTQAQINVALATVTYQGALNFNGSDTLTVTSTDSNSSTDVDTVAITVTVANDAPTDLSLSANTVVENAANGTIIGTVSGTDPDSGDTKSYSFTDDAGGRFAINSATGVITVADGSLLDYEAATNHSVTVRVTDSGGLTYDETFTITMTNLNETPTTISLSGNTVVENAVNGTVVGTASTTDPDAGDTHTYQLTDDAGGRFAIDVNTGQITVADGTLLDYESATSHAITVRTTDAGGLTHDQIFTIMLTDVNEAPTGADATVTITEDTPHTLTAANFGFSDVDAGDSLSAVRIDTLPGAGSLTLSGVPVTVGQVISVANITAGNLVFTAAADANGTGYASFTFSVRDSNNAYDTAPNTLTFDVTPVNDAPANTVPGPQTVAEDSLLSLSGISVTDVDGNLSTVQLGVLNGTVSVTLSGTASISAGANGTNTLTLSGTEADINAALATLTYQGGTNFNGSDLLTITSTDSNSGTDVDTVAITVNAVNDPTVITGGTSGTGNEDTTLTGTLTATDVEGLADGTVFTVSTNATNGTASIDPATGLWSYSPNADWNGTDSFTVTITDDVGNATTQVISVTVTPVVDLTNDSLTTNEDTAISANVLTGTNGATADSFEGTPVLTSVTQGANGSVSFLADGTVTYTPNANFSGTDSFTYTITSGGVSETATVTVTVNAVNDPTVVTGGTSGTGTEDTTITGTLTATDADGLSDGSMFTVSTTATNGTASIDPATGLWSYTPNADYNGSDSFTVTITDDAGNSSTQVISVTVSPVVDITNDSLTTTEDSAISANVLTGTNGATTDSFEGTPVLTSVTQGANGTVTSLANGTVTYTPNANFNGTDSFTYTITSGGVTETATVNVTVTAVNDAPVNTLPGAQTVAEDQPLTISGLSVTDVDGNLSTVQLAVGNGTLNVTLSGTASISAGANGTNTLTLSGTQADINAALATLAYQGNVNFNGSDLLTITSTDTNSVTDVDTVALTVTAVNDAPFLVSNTGSTVAEGGADTINVSELAVTDVDNTAAQLTYTIGTGPASGRLELTTAPGVSATSFTQADIAANRLIYIHNGSETTSDSFTFTVNDGAGGTLGPTTVTLTIMPINDAPTITSNGGASTAAINVAENVSAVTIVTGADVDLPTQALTYSISGGADQALFTINTVTGALNFVAPPDFEVATDANGDNVYVVQVQVLDSQGASTTQTIQVTVMNVAEGVSITPTSPTVPPILLSPVPPPSSGGSMPESETLPAVGSPTPVDSEAVPTPVLPGPTIHPVDVLPIAQGLVTPVQFPDRPLERVLEESRKLMDETKDRALFLVNDDQGRPLFSVLPVEPTPTLEPEPPEPKPSVSDLLMAKLDEMTVSLERAVNVSQERHELIARITAVTGTTLSAGFIVWALRSGTIMASLLATMPAWRHFDPLPVVKLSRHERKHRRDDATRAQEQEAAEFKGLNRVLGDKPPLKRTA